MAELKNFDIRNAKKLLQLIYVIAQQVPFKPNLTNLAAKTGVHRNSLTNYLHYLEQAKIITMLYPAGNSNAILQKPEKIYLNNTTLLTALAEEQANIGSVRETFFLSQIQTLYKVQFPQQGDFIVRGKYTFEIGGKGKKSKQIEAVSNAWVVKDDIEYPIMNVLPLWVFGMLY
jgi:predicted AAA+ superfamily ATPase